MAGLILLPLLGAANAQQRLSEFQRFDPTSEEIVSHDAFARFLDAYARLNDDGIVYFAYGQVSETDHRALKQYLAELQAVNPITLNQNEAFAFWANFYNALTLDVVLDAYPVDSIREIRPGILSNGPWREKRVTVNNIDLSLDNIEHDILRAFWDEPRIHYAVNCASIGCPNLPLTPLTGNGLDERLDVAAGAYVNHPRGVRVDQGTVTASSIYRWFREDFGTDDAEIIAHWRQYAEPGLSDALESVKRIDAYDYDWTLNDLRDEANSPVVSGHTIAPGGFTIPRR